MTEKLPEEPQFYMRKWYYTREEIEDFSPSRKDGISFEKESELRKLYCSFLQKLGMKLNLSQVTVACAMMLCHRFYMRQSHAKNDWQTIATVSIFLGSKIEETKCMLGDVAVMSYDIMYKWDASAPQRIRQKRDVYYKQKELILTGERLLLATIAFDFDIQLPYKPLVAALRRLDLFRDLAKVAWNFVNDWLCTTLCLQYKPHYIAAGSMFLAAKFQKVKLPSNKEKSWWLEFDISPMQLEVVIREMLKLLEQDRKQTLPRRHEKVTQPSAPTENTNIKSPQSCVSDGCIANRPSNNGARAENDRDGKSLAGGGKHISVEEELPCQTGNSTSSSVVEDSEGSSQPRTAESDHKPAYDMTSVNNIHSKIDANRIKAALKRRKREGAANKKLIKAVDPELDSDEAWIEKELENGIELESASSKKKQARYCEVLKY